MEPELIETIQTVLTRLNAQRQEAGIREYLEGQFIFNSRTLLLLLTESFHLVEIPLGIKAEIKRELTRNVEVAVIPPAAPRAVNRLMIRIAPPPPTGGDPWENLRGGCTGTFPMPRGQWDVTLTGHGEGAFFGNLYLETLIDGRYQPLPEHMTVPMIANGSNRNFGGTWNGNPGQSAGPFTLKDRLVLVLSGDTHIRIALKQRIGADNITWMNGVELMAIRRD